MQVAPEAHAQFQLEHDELRLGGSADDLGERNDLDRRLAFLRITEKRSQHGGVSGQVNIAVRAKKQT